MSGSQMAHSGSGRLSSRCRLFAMASAAWSAACSCDLTLARMCLNLSKTYSRSCISTKTNSLPTAFPMGSRSMDPDDDVPASQWSEDFMMMAMAGCWWTLSIRATSLRGITKSTRPV